MADKRQPVASIRGNVAPKLASSATDKETFIELELTEERRRIQPHQLLFLLERIKENSANFEKSGEQAKSPTNNKAHLFIKLYFWHENFTVSSITIIDMAGYPLKPKKIQGLPKNHLHAYQEKYSELNSQGINYLLYVFKDMLFKENNKEHT